MRSAVGDSSVPAVKVEDTVIQARKRRPERRHKRKITPLQISVAVVVVWAPLVVAVPLGIAMWTGYPPWLVIPTAIPGVFVATSIPCLSPRGRDIAVGMATGVSAAALIGSLALVLGSVRQWSGIPAFIACMCANSVLVGVLFGQWVAWRRGDT